ncbi:hypothetical protein L484_004715 [Morus notabilis]|uniref:Uncharacterized protein n=1 Tax=Morus notabilis TaxID=981085 RepID=W9SH07_9ROSA|nr:hypothetical protein L484_004715 [Morus notabilis]
MTSRGKTLTSGDETPASGSSTPYSVARLHSPLTDFHLLKRKRGKVEVIQFGAPGDCRFNMIMRLLLLNITAVERKRDELCEERDSLKELLIKEKDKARTRDEEMLDLHAQLESSDKVAAKDLQISELSDLADEWYTDRWSCGQLELLRLFRDCKLEKNGLKAKIMEVVEYLDEVEAADFATPDDKEEQPERALEHLEDRVRHRNEPPSQDMEVEGAEAEEKKRRKSTAATIDSFNPEVGIGKDRHRYDVINLLMSESSIVEDFLLHFVAHYHLKEWEDGPLLILEDEYRANGRGGKTPSDVVEELEKGPDDVNIDDDTFNSIHNTMAIKESSSVLGSVIEKAYARLSCAISEDMMEKHSRLSDELQRTTTINTMERHKVARMMMKDDALVSYFFSIPDDERGEWAIAFLAGDI